MKMTLNEVLWQCLDKGGGFRRGGWAAGRVAYPTWGEIWVKQIANKSLRLFERPELLQFTLADLLADDYVHVNAREALTEDLR